MRTNYKNIPLIIDDDFINIICLDKVSLFKQIISRLTSLYDYKDIITNDDPIEGYIFARGTLPVCLCAHLDKVYSYDSALKPLTKISKKIIRDKLGNILDYHLYSSEGIGGDDRCGVYSILAMLNKGFRPSVLFCFGEEIGCRGSRKFTLDHSKDFLDGINAFIQIDRRGNRDCVNYSDRSMTLVNEITKFGFKYNYGSCTDISILMPHFGISGVNLSSGYYHEHSGKSEYISIKDFNFLLKRLEKILSSNIFETKYLYESGFNSNLFNTSFSFSKRTLASDDNDNNCHQLFIDFDDNTIKEAPVSKLGKCCYCGFSYFTEDLVEAESLGCVCPSCAEDLLRTNLILDKSFTKCDCCGNLFNSSEQQCPFCGNDNLYNEM